MATLNEKQRRLYAAFEAKQYGYGGVTLFSQATGINRDTINEGIKEIESGTILTGDRVRRPGGGRTKAIVKMPKLEDAIELEANPKTDRRVMVKWTSNSLEHILQALQLRGFHVSLMTVYNILREKGYALKANKKDIEGGEDHPDRDGQFQYLNMMGLKMQLQGFPILSIDAKKTEKIGKLKNNKFEWMPKGEATKVNVYDFGEKDKQTKKIKKAIPYGVYDVLKKLGFVNVGIDHNTAAFAGESLRSYWEQDGKKNYPEATEILLFADSGSSNGIRNTLWKAALQRFSNRTGLTVHVCHYPPGTSKWNSIEHEMFSFITINWRAKPLTAYEVILELIRHTTTKTGLTIHAVLDTNTYETGKRLTEEELKQIQIKGHVFHPEWNYTVKPNIDM